MTQKKMVWPDTRREQSAGRNQKEKLWEERTDWRLHRKLIKVEMILEEENIKDRYFKPGKVRKEWLIY
jgi:hypothetical protein